MTESCLVDSDRVPGFFPRDSDRVPGFFPRDSAGCSGFSLLELLVSISIVGLLFSTLVPVCLAVRAEAGAVRCTAALRELGIAVHLYAERWGGALPHEDGGKTLPPFGCGWYQVLGEFLADPDGIVCPSTRERGFSYKMNSRLEPEAVPFRNLDRFPVPSRTVLFFDGRTDNRGVAFLPKGTWDTAAIRHRGTTNVLFADGHVERMTVPGDGVGWDGPGGLVWEIVE